MPADCRPAINLERWQERARELFGVDPLNWRFVCPSCSHVASVADYRKAGAPQGAVGYSCVGRWLGADGRNTFKRKGGPCDYTGAGLFGLNPVRIALGEGESDYWVFEFAEVNP